MLAGLLVSATARAQDQRALFALVINQVDKGEILVILRGADVLAAVGSLEATGLKGFAGQRETINGEAFVSLDSLKPDVTYTLDERALVLRLTARPELLGSNVLQVESDRPPDIEYRRDRSAFANYAVNVGSGIGYDYFVDAGVSSGGALFTTTFSGARGEPTVRGLSSVTLDRPKELRRIVAGDAFASSGLLGGAVLMGGASVSREYSLDPYFVRYPTFSLSGAVVTPSIVEVYVNDRLVRTEQIQPGEFDLTKVPITNGRNDAKIIIRDAFGGVRELSQGYYLTTNVLAKGLQEYEYSAGFVRHGFGTDSWSYGTPVFVGHHRVGLSDTLTAGGRLELRSDLVSLGPDLTARLPFGELEGSVAISREQGFGGAALAGAYNYSGKPAGFGGSLRLMTSHYATTSLHAGDDRPLVDAAEFASVQLGPKASLTLQRRDATLSLSGSSTRTAIIGSMRVNGRTDIFLSGTAEHSSSFGASREFFVGVSVRVVPHAMANVSYEHSPDGDRLVTDLQQPVPVGTGWGYRFHGERGDSSASAAAAQYQGRYGRYEVRSDSFGGQQETTAAINGGIAAIGGGIYPSRPIQDGFALVRVPRVPGVRAYASNQEIGRTDAGGNLLVPNLLSYYGNVLNISDQDIPLDHAVGAVRKTVAPPYRGGALVEFPVARVQSVSGTLQLTVAGSNIAPAYAQLTIEENGKKYESPVGEKGEFYLENVPPGKHEAVVEYHDITCRFTLTIPASDAPVITTGTVTCTPQ